MVTLPDGTAAVLREDSLALRSTAKFYTDTNAGKAIRKFTWGWSDEKYAQRQATDDLTLLVFGTTFKKAEEIYRAS